jgi:hypothetical protein
MTELEQCFDVVIVIGGARLRSLLESLITAFWLSSSPRPISARLRKHAGIGAGSEKQAVEIACAGF